MPTSGAVIGTGHIRFMDGSSMRMPSTGWFTKDQVNMEGTGAKPDIFSRTNSTANNKKILTYNCNVL